MKRKYDIKVTSFEELAKAFPKAVKETVHRTHDYWYLAGLADRDIEIPGVEVAKSVQIDLEDITNV